MDFFSNVDFLALFEHVHVNATVLYIRVPLYVGIDVIVIRCGVKPTPTVSVDQDSVDMLAMKEKRLSAITRRDISLLPRWYPVAEAMTAIAITDALFMARGWYGVSKMDPKWEHLTAPRNPGEYTK